MDLTRRQFLGALTAVVAVPLKMAPSGVFPHFDPAVHVVETFAPRTIVIDSVTDYWEKMMLHSMHYGMPAERFAKLVLEKPEHAGDIYASQMPTAQTVSLAGARRGSKTFDGEQRLRARAFVDREMRRVQAVSLRKREPREIIEDVLWGQSGL